MQPTERPRTAEREPSKEPPDRSQAKADVVQESFRRLLRRGAITNLIKMLGRMHPADVARVIQHLSLGKEKRTVFELVKGESQRGQVLSELDAGSIQELMADLAATDAAWLLKDLGPDDQAYILGEIGRASCRERV